MTIGATVSAFFPRPGRWGTSVVCSKSGTPERVRRAEHHRVDEGTMLPSGSTVAPLTHDMRASWGPRLFTTISWLPMSSSTCSATRWMPLLRSSTEL
jgi:hypothetical protein